MITVSPTMTETSATLIHLTRNSPIICANVDVTVIAERPKIGPHRDAMRSALAQALGVDPGAVSVKGKTNEGMGWVGRGEGLACIAVALLRD